MKEVRFLTALALLVLASFLASAYDPSPLQDFCVGIPEPNGVFVNGKFCKDPKLVTANDFYLQAGLNTPANAAANKYGFAVKLVLVDQLPGLNTLGISVVRADWVPGGETPPHSHPRATEIMVVLEGTVLAGFVASNDNNNTLFAKVLNPGDVFVFPIGQIHFQANVGKFNASALVGFNSQNPGVITIADTVFGSKPHINTDILAKAFQVNADVIKELEKQFG